MKAYVSIIICIVSLFFPPCLHAQGNTSPSTLYICQKDMARPVTIDSTMNLHFSDDATIVGARRYDNSSIDSITMFRPAGNLLAGLGETASLDANGGKINGATLLDVTSRTGEDEHLLRNVYSAWYLLTVAGMPFDTTNDLSKALADSRLIVISSVVDSTTFTDSELQQITQWVENGGVLVMQAALTANGESPLAQLVGYSKVKDFNQNINITWNTSLSNEPAFDYINTDEEKVTIMPRSSYTRSYHFTDLKANVDTLATISESTVKDWIMAVRTRHGKGSIYSYGTPWCIMVQQAQLGKDSWRRTKNNNFEPSADAVAFQLRSIYCHLNEPAVWKFTIPDGYESVLIPTHDCDSKTALDSMRFMSDYEKSLGASCHYFITTHYYAEPQDTGEVRLGLGYTEDRIPNIKRLLASRHTVGSHSIGHFPDFNFVSRFPMTITTRDEYHALYSNRTQSTSGGSTWAEVVLSKQILEGDLHNHVRSFRTGHLCMNDSIPHAEQIGNYNFASCYTAHDVRSEFPFQERLGNRPDGEFNGVLEMPLHFSDVFNGRGAIKMDADNWQDKVEIWKDVHKKLADNYAPGIVLIHPNRRWKMEAEKMLVDSYDHSRIGIYNFEAYGDWWRQRMATGFSYAYNKNENTVVIRIDTPAEHPERLTFAVENLPTDKAPKANLTDSDGTVIAIGQAKELTTGRYLIVF